MRHGNKINHLSRTAPHRKAMLQNMATSLILHKRIQTTLAKAKSLRKYVEPLLTKAKEDSTHNRRIVFSELQSKAAITELFTHVSGKIVNRNGGYTRILKLGDNRAGDNAEMCMIELVDYNDAMLKETKTGVKKKTRRGSSKTTAEVSIKPETEKKKTPKTKKEKTSDTFPDEKEKKEETPEE